MHHTVVGLVSAQSECRPLDMVELRLGSKLASCVAQLKYRCLLSSSSRFGMQVLSVLTPTDTYLLSVHLHALSKSVEFSIRRKVKSLLFEHLVQSLVGKGDA